MVDGVLRQEQHEDLVHALVAPDQWNLYRSSASFHAGIDTLARMLPAMVSGLAAEAEAQSEKARLYEQLLRSGEDWTPPLSFMDHFVERPADAGEESTRG